MKILAAGDIHGDSRQAKKLAEKAAKAKVDLVVLCGDLTLVEQPTSDLIKPFIKKNKKVVLIPGNHESIATADFFADVYDATNLHGYSIIYKNVALFGCGGASNVGPAPPVTEDEILKLLKKGHDKIKNFKKKIMVTHMHPKGTLMEKLSHWVPPSAAVAKAVKKFKPDILLCSHIHEAEGIEEKIGKTKVINVGKEGKIIEI
jgi:hypothetical protein